MEFSLRKFETFCREEVKRIRVYIEEQIPGVYYGGDYPAEFDTVKTCTSPDMILMTDSAGWAPPMTIYRVRRVDGRRADGEAGNTYDILTIVREEGYEDILLLAARK